MLVIPTNLVSIVNLFSSPYLKLNIRINWPNYYCFFIPSDIIFAAPESSLVLETIICSSHKWCTVWLNCLGTTNDISSLKHRNRNDIELRGTYRVSQEERTKLREGVPYVPPVTPCIVTTGL